MFVSLIIKSPPFNSRCFSLSLITILLFKGSCGRCRLGPCEEPEKQMNMWKVLILNDSLIPQLLLAENVSSYAGPIITFYPTKNRTTRSNSCPIDVRRTLGNEWLIILVKHKAYSRMKSCFIATFCAIGPYDYTSG